MAVSQATRAWGSWASMPSRTASETWSQTLSGCPSVTDSDVRRNDFDALNEVVTTAANHTRGGVGDPGGAVLLRTVSLPAVFGRLAQQLSLKREDVIEHAIDAPALEAMVGDKDRKTTRLTSSHI